MCIYGAVRKPPTPPCVPRQKSPRDMCICDVVRKPPAPVHAAAGKPTRNMCIYGAAQKIPLRSDRSKGDLCYEVPAALAPHSAAIPRRNQRHDHAALIPHTAAGLSFQRRNPRRPSYNHAVRTAFRSYPAPQSTPQPAALIPRSYRTPRRACHSHHNQRHDQRRAHTAISAAIKTTKTARTPHYIAGVAEASSFSSSLRRKIKPTKMPVSAQSMRMMITSRMFDQAEAPPCAAAEMPKSTLALAPR